MGVDVASVRREAALAEAILPLLRRRLDAGPVEIHRLPNGTFAPKGLGQVLTAGTHVVINDPRALERSHGRVIDVTGKQATVAVHHGPRAGGRIRASAESAAQGADDDLKDLFGLTDLPVPSTKDESAVHAHHIRKLGPGESYSVDGPEGAITVTRNEERRRPGFHVSGGGQAADAELRRGPRQLIGSGNVAQEVAERVASAHHADDVHTAQHAARARAGKGEPVAVHSLNGHRFEVRREKDGSFSVSYPDNPEIKSHGHVSPVVAVQAGKHTLRAKGAKFLEEGNDSDPLSTLPTHRKVAANVVAGSRETSERSEKFQERKELYDPGDQSGEIMAAYLKTGILQKPEEGERALERVRHVKDAAKAAHAAVFPHVDQLAHHAHGVATAHAAVITHHAHLAMHMLQGEDGTMADDELREFWSEKARAAALAARRARHHASVDVDKAFGMERRSYPSHMITGGHQRERIAGMALGAQKDAERADLRREADRLRGQGIKDPDDALEIAYHARSGNPPEVRERVRSLYRKHGVRVPDELREGGGLLGELSESDLRALRALGLAE